MRDLSLTTYLSAVASSVARTSPRALARRPLEQWAGQLIGQHPAVDLSAVTGQISFEAHLGGEETRHAWSLHASDQFILQSLIAARDVKRVFEIGTFNGGTTRIIAECLPDDGIVWTLDLPPTDFDRTQGPKNFTGSDVGREYRTSPAAGKVQQILADSLEFDVEPYRGQCDLVFIDGAHDYAHGVSDTLKAFELVAPDGVIVWDDFQPYWHGLVRGIYEGAGANPPRRLAGSNLGIWTQAFSSHPVPV
jgi:predicted O-methyltransferase YrrM